MVVAADSELVYARAVAVSVGFFWVLRSGAQIESQLAKAMVRLVERARTRVGCEWSK